MTNLKRAFKTVAVVPSASEVEEPLKQAANEMENQVIEVLKGVEKIGTFVKKYDEVKAVRDNVTVQAKPTTPGVDNDENKSGPSLSR